MIDYTVKRKFIRHKWRGKTFSVFDRMSFIYDTMAMEIRREIDAEIIKMMLAAFKDEADAAVIDEELHHGNKEDHEDREASSGEDQAER